MPLPKKLGIKTGHNVVLLNAPAKFERTLHRTNDVRISRQLKLPTVDVVVLFVSGLEELERRFSEIASKLHPAGGFWVAWPKRRSAGISGDLVRRIGLAAGLVDNKSCAIDAAWEGVRLVMRGENRDAVAYRAAPPQAVKRTRRVTAAARVSSGAGSTMRRARARQSR
jgi:hypothetical protein